MTTNALAELEADATTIKRAQWEGYEFHLEAPGLVRVTNGSYGDEADEHTYLVDVEGGVPVACECPADTYKDGACKHRVAVAIRTPVLQAATGCSNDAAIATDGGQVIDENDGDGDEDEPCLCEMESATEMELGCHEHHEAPEVRTMSKTATGRESTRQTVEAPRLTDEDLVVDLLNVTGATSSGADLRARRSDAGTPA